MLRLARRWSARRRHRVARVAPRLEPLEGRDLPSFGALDPAFGVGGRVLTAFTPPVWVSGMALQTDGKIVLAGYTGSWGAAPDFAVVRYDADGTPDATFGTGGLVTTDFGGNDEAAGVAIEPNGAILVAGTTDRGFAAARYTPAGLPDPTFGTQGKVSTDFGAQAVGLVLEPNGKFVVAGGAFTGPPRRCCRPPPPRWVPSPAPGRNSSFWRGSPRTAR